MFVAVPDEYSNPLVFALPIILILDSAPTLGVPLTAVAVLYKVTFLNDSESPETKPTSGAPYVLVTFK